MEENRNYGLDIETAKQIRTSAEKLHSQNKVLSKDKIKEIFENKEGDSKKYIPIKLPKNYFEPDKTQDEIIAEIIKALDFYRSQNTEEDVQNDAGTGSIPPIIRKSKNPKYADISID